MSWFQRPWDISFPVFLFEDAKKADRTAMLRFVQSLGCSYTGWNETRKRKFLIISGATQYE